MVWQSYASKVKKRTKASTSDDFVNLFWPMEEDNEENLTKGELRILDSIGQLAVEEDGEDKNRAEMDPPRRYFLAPK